MPSLCAPVNQNAELNWPTQAPNFDVEGRHSIICSAWVPSRHALVNSPSCSSTTYLASLYFEDLMAIAAFSPRRCRPKNNLIITIHNNSSGGGLTDTRERSRSQAPANHGAASTSAWSSGLETASGPCHNGGSNATSWTVILTTAKPPSAAGIPIRLVRRTLVCLALSLNQRSCRDVASLNNFDTSVFRWAGASKSQNGSVLASSCVPVTDFQHCLIWLVCFV